MNVYLKPCMFVRSTCMCVPSVLRIWMPRVAFSVCFSYVLCECVGRMYPPCAPFLCEMWVSLCVTLSFGCLLYCSYLDLCFLCYIYFLPTLQYLHYVFLSSASPLCSILVRDVIFSLCYLSFVGCLLYYLYFDLCFLGYICFLSSLQYFYCVFLSIASPSCYIACSVLKLSARLRNWVSLRVLRVSLPRITSRSSPASVLYAYPKCCTRISRLMWPFFWRDYPVVWKWHHVRRFLPLGFGTSE